ncbi:MFS transport protein AraJ [Klebsiella variicola]|nr:MFS transport protein AraJ [Klebsiella variicola]
MGVLPDMAHDVGMSIPAAGNMIAWYAFGVVIGAPIMALLSSRFSLKSVMLFLAALCILGNTLFTLSSSYAMLALAAWFPVFLTGVLWRRRDYPVENRAAGEGDRRGGGDDRRMTVANLVGSPRHLAWASLQLALYLCPYRRV